MDTKVQPSPNPPQPPTAPRFRWGRLLLWLPVCLVHGGAVAWAATLVERFSAPVLLFSLLVGAALGGTLVGAIRLLQIGNRPTVLLGTVEGDIHEIGKNIFLALLQGNGVKVVDLGVQAAPAAFLEKAQQVEADVIGMSSLLTTTMPAMQETIELFEAQGVRRQYKFIVGGAPVSKKFADEIGADGYGEDAQSGVELVKRMMGV